MSELLERSCRVCGCTGQFALTAADVGLLNAAPPVGFEVGRVGAFFIMAALQAACRHQGLQGPARQVVEDFARGLQESVSITPNLAKLAEAGWHRKYDPLPRAPGQEERRIILPGE